MLEQAFDHLALVHKRSIEILNVDDGLRDDAASFAFKRTKRYDDVEIRVYMLENNIGKDDDTACYITVGVGHICDMRHGLKLFSRHLAICDFNA